MVAIDEFQRANRRGRSLREKMPVVIAARYDRKIGRVVLSLRSGLDILFPPQNAEGLERASSAELREIEISPSGMGIYFPKLDVRFVRPCSPRGIARLAQVDGGEARRRGRQQNQHGQKARLASQWKIRRQTETLRRWLSGPTCPLRLLLFES